MLPRSLWKLALCAAALIALPAGAADRFALVIGNGAYRDVDPLANPPNDVRLVSDALRGVGFQVETLVDVDKRSMEDAVRKFAEQLDQAGRNAVGVFYFAGHGVSYEGENWLIPVRAPIKQGVDIEYEAVSANKVLKLMERARNATDILILDACRNSPFRGFSLSGTRAISRGMSRMDAPAGSFIAYSTAPGDVAYDGRGDYSPFAEAFAAEVGTSTKSISDMMIDVRKKVKDATTGLGPEPQTPWDASSLTGHFSFSLPAGAQQATAGSGQPVPPAQTQTLQQPERRPTAEERFWTTVQNSEDPAEYEAYLKRYPNGEFAEIARVRRDRYSKPESPASTPAGSLPSMPAGETFAGGGAGGPDPEALAFCRQFAGTESYEYCLEGFEESGADSGMPPDIRAWDGAADFPSGMPSMQQPGATMVWYDDAYNQWQVTTSGPGFTATATIPGTGPIMLRGQTQGYGIAYTIHDATGQQIGYGQGSMMDATHISVMSYYSNGVLMASGRFHINHPPN